MRRSIEDANKKYEGMLSTYKLQDPQKIQETYLDYIEKFKETLYLYAAYRSEIFKDFPVDRCGKTYGEIENHFKNRWDRYQTLTWRAYRSADELAQISEGKELKLDLKLVGVSHFARLHRIFQYMVLQHELNDITEDGIVSATGMLYGSLSDYDNLEKAVREWTRTLLFYTFEVGISWLAQMHTYLLDMFKQSVKLYLLAPGKFNGILEHTIFLNAVDRDYHKTVRKWSRKAVQTIRDTYESFGAYVHYDITARLRKLAFAIPTHVKHNSFEHTVPNVFIQTDNTENNHGYKPATIADILKNVPQQKILDRIYGSESYLTQQRDQQKLDHHGNGRCVIEEIYRATCGLLVSHIISLFNSNVVACIQEFGSSKMFCLPSRSQSLYTRISRMSAMEIGRIANVNVEEVQYEIKQCESKIGDLMVAQRLVSNATNAMLSPSPINEEQRKREHTKTKELADSHVRGLQKRRGYFDHQLRTEISGHTQSLSTSTNVDITSLSQKDYSDESELEEDQLMNEGDKMHAKMLMLEYYRRHDKEDLSLGLASIDCLSQDESRPSTLAHIYVDPDTMDYDKAISNIPPSVIQHKPDANVPSARTSKLSSVDS